MTVNQFKIRIQLEYFQNIEYWFQLTFILLIRFVFSFITKTAELLVAYNLYKHSIPSVFYKKY